MIKKILVLVVLAMSMTACGDNGFDVMQTLKSDALTSCGQCVSDISKAQTQEANNASVEKMFENAKLELPIIR